MRRSRRDDDHFVATGPGRERAGRPRDAGACVVALVAGVLALAAFAATAPTGHASPRGGGPQRFTSSAPSLMDSASPLPEPAAVLSDTRRAGDWQLAQLASPVSRTWQRGVLLAGLLALEDAVPGAGYADVVQAMSYANGWRLGRGESLADAQCIGQAYAELAERLDRRAVLRPTRASLDRMLARPRGGSLAITSRRALERWAWCDTLFMAPPTWARVYRITGDRRYRDFLVRQWRRTTSYLLDPEERLYYRDSSFFAVRDANGAKVFWSRGNGWVLAGLARVLQVLPADDPARPRLIGQFRQLAARVLACQSADGLWRMSLLDPQDLPQPEASGTALFCYALAWGVDQGLLDAARYDPAIAAAWAGLSDCLAPDGRLTRVQPPGSGPAAFDPQNTDQYGTGAFLLAGSEVYRWTKARGAGRPPATSPAQGVTHE